MAVTVCVDGKKKSARLKPGVTARDVVAKLGLRNNTVILKRNGSLAHPSEKLADGDRLDVVNIIYGG